MIRCVVPISGGKDSQACLRLALQSFQPEEVLGLFCDTQFEHPDTYRHIDRLRTLYGPVTIVTVSEGSVDDKIRKYKRFPGGGARHCTDELKIRPTKRFLKALAENMGHGFEVWYGMRSAESPEREKRYHGKVSDHLYAPHEVMPSKYPKYLAKLGIMFRLAILDWPESEVLGFLEGQLNPLYAAGFPRVGCFPCQASGDKWKEKAYAHDAFGASQRIRVIQLGHEIGKNPFTTKGGRARNPDAEGPGCMICSY